MITISVFLQKALNTVIEYLEHVHFVFKLHVITAYSLTRL